MTPETAALRSKLGQRRGAGRLAQALNGDRRYLTRLPENIRSLVAKGAQISQAASAAQSGKDARGELFEEYNARNATAAFAELEWE